MVARKQQRRRVATTHSSNGEGRANSCRRLGRSRARRWLIRSHSTTASAESSNRSRSARTLCAASVTFATTNVVRSVPVASTARSINVRSSRVVRTSNRLSRERAVLLAIRGPLRGHRFVRPVYGQNSRSVNQTIAGRRLSLHHTCTTSEGQTRSTTVTHGHSDLSHDLRKHTNVLITCLSRRTFAT
jgi:hypothetical protein